MASTKQLQADFYVLPVADLAARQRFVCRLAEKIVPQGHRLHIHCNDEACARELDSLLWSFRDDSFIPHALAGSGLPAPVQIGWSATQIDKQRVFVNLTETLPESVPGIARVVEIVVQTDSILSATRQHFRQYKEAGYHINMTDMRPRH
ncbi:MAG: DNA polymerase III subunit chi [Marinobacterium sp.]|nr:DNA polymerase III subunit chi [Marinobacterium sp.]